MNEMLEDDLKEFYAAYDAGYDPSGALDRLRDLDYRPRVVHRRSLWVAALAAVPVVAVVVVVASIVFGSSGALPEQPRVSIAYAAWTSAPMPATPAAIAAASTICDQHYLPVRIPSSPLSENPQKDVFAGQPVLSEGRGAYIALVSLSDGQVYSCVVDPVHVGEVGLFTLGIWAYGPVGTSPGVDQITVPYQGLSGEGSGSGLDANVDTLGQAGSDVLAISFTFADGKSVAATVQNGWYFAWWPWATTPTSVAVTTNAGVFTSPVSRSGSPSGSVVPQCNPGSSGCVFSDTSPETH